MNNPDVSQQATISETERLELADQLLKTEEDLPESLAHNILAAGPDIVPDLIELIADDLKDDDDREWFSIHAARLLGKIGDVRAASVLLDCVEQCDFDEYLSNDAALALRKMGEIIVEPCLERYSNAVSDDFRSIVASIACDSGVNDERLFQIASETLERDLTHGANCFYGLGDEQALPLLRTKFDEFEVSTDTDNPFANQDLIELKAAIEHLGGRLTPEQEQKFELSDEPRRIFRETMERVMELQENQNKSVVNRGKTVVNDRKIGRNEPCWCGSGKKYKKCHLPLDR